MKKVIFDVKVPKEYKDFHFRFAVLVDKCLAAWNDSQKNKTIAKYDYYLLQKKELDNFLAQNVNLLK